MGHKTVVIKKPVHIKSQDGDVVGDCRRWGCDVRRHRGRVGRWPPQELRSLWKACHAKWTERSVDTAHRKGPKQFLPNFPLLENKASGSGQRKHPLPKRPGEDP